MSEIVRKWKKFVQLICIKSIEKSSNQRGREEKHNNCVNNSLIILQKKALQRYRQQQSKNSFVLTPSLDS